MIGSCIASFITIWVGPVGPAWDGAVDNAIDYWRNQGVFIQEVDYANQALVTVERRKMDKDVGGATAQFKLPSGKPFGGKIWLNRVNLTKKQRGRIAAHEIGHALGFDHTGLPGLMDRQASGWRLPKYELCR